MNKWFRMFFFLVLATSCAEHAELTTEKSVNSFEMQLNNNQWLPTTVDPCTKAMQCNMSTRNSGNFYKIEAYQHPEFKFDYDSEMIVELQVMDVNSTGTYILNDTFGSFQNYARVIINRNGVKTLYQNRAQASSFSVEVLEIFSNQFSSLKGIKGTFKGVLFNSSNPGDSIQIENGSFTFRKINHYNFNQCQN